MVSIRKVAIVLACFRFDLTRFQDCRTGCKRILIANILFLKLSLLSFDY